MLLDRFGQSNKLRRKSENKFSDIQGDILRTSWGRPESTSQRRPLNVKLGRPMTLFQTFRGRQVGTSPERQIGRSLGWSNRISRELLGDVGGRRARDILGTNICWLVSGNLNSSFHVGVIILSLLFLCYCLFPRVIDRYVLKNNMFIRTS